MIYSLGMKKKFKLMHQYSKEEIDEINNRSAVKHSPDSWGEVFAESIVGALVVAVAFGGGWLLLFILRLLVRVFH